MRYLIIVVFVMNIFANEIYIWSKTFHKLDNNKIIKFLKKNNINKTIVSFKDENKFREFLSLCKQNGIEVDILIGNNSWIYKKNREKIDKKLNYLKNFKNYNIHLDIEPHAIKSLKHNRKLYFKMYVEMLEYIHNKFPKYKISISIPTFYKIDFKKISFVNKIYLMAYQYKNLNQLLRRVNRYNFLKNIVVVFNCKEFDNKTILLDDVNFIKMYGYKNIAFHSLKTCLRIYR